MKSTGMLSHFFFIFQWNTFTGSGRRYFTEKAKWNLRAYLWLHEKHKYGLRWGRSGIVVSTSFFVMYLHLLFKGMHIRLTGNSKMSVLVNVRVHCWLYCGLDWQPIQDVPVFFPSYDSWDNHPITVTCSLKKLKMLEYKYNTFEFLFLQCTNFWLSFLNFSQENISFLSFLPPLFSIIPDMIVIFK